MGKMRLRTFDEVKEGIGTATLDLGSIGKVALW